MVNSAAFPEGYVKDVSMEAFEVVIARLKTHADEDARSLGEAADACFLLWQLAGEESALAIQTISEHLPGLIDLIYKGNP